MDPINNYVSTTPDAPIAGRALDKDAFLKLLTAQLQYQDPLNPSSQDQMFGTLSQMGMVEQITNLNSKVGNLVQDNNLNLIGRRVTVSAKEDQTLTGVVRGIVYEEGGPYMMIGTQKVPVGNILKVEQES